MQRFIPADEKKPQGPFPCIFSSERSVKRLAISQSFNLNRQPKKLSENCQLLGATIGETAAHMFVREDFELRSNNADGNFQTASNLSYRRRMYQEGKTVVVGMSGGVDSSVAAALLHEQGYRVIGLFMKNWEEQLPNGVCQATVDYEDVVNTCNKIQIPHIAVSFSKEYQESVFADFLKLYNLGLTPNPDILCNREIKFKALYEKALELDADYLATGHYCQTVSGKLYKGKDPLKDQSYFLHAIDGKVLEKVLFPVGGIEKPVVRQIAAKYALPTQQKKDSTGICFIGERKFREFLLNYLPAQPGEFRRLDETIVGEHLGVAYYTIGQRRRLGLGGEGERWFVLKKDCKKNIVYVERGDHPALYKDTLVAKDLTWIQAPPEDSAMLTAKIRYRQNDQECRIVYLDATTAKVTFQTPQRAITSGQYVVFYSGDVCLGGGVITDEEA